MKRCGFFWMALGLLFLAPPYADAQVKDVSWGTSAVGSTGHKALVNLAALLNREMKEYRFTVLPMPGAIATVKGYAVGKLDAYYGADIAFHEMAGDTARFKGFRAQMKREPLQSFWAFTLENGLGINARDRAKYKRWRDLSGERVFTGPLPWDTRATLERAMAAVGVKHRYVEVDLAVAGSALQRGDIRGLIVYTAGGKSPPPWIVEAQLTTDIAVLNPSQEEIKLLRKAGMREVEIDPKRAFKKDVFVEKFISVPLFYGFHVGLDFPEQDLYRMLTIIEKYTNELVKMDPSFSQIGADMKGFQRRGVESSVADVRIHPGLARYMRDRGVWDSKWDNRVAKVK